MMHLLNDTVNIQLLLANTDDGCSSVVEAIGSDDRNGLVTFGTTQGRR